jgi:SHS2 domain-containing protein
MLNYKLIDHTADFGLHVFGADPKDLFANAAHAMFDVITDISSLTGLSSGNIRVTGDDWPDLMVNWLRELLYFWSGTEMLVKIVEIQSISAHELSAKVKFDPYNPDQHTINTEIKAVTYHQIQVVSGPSGWEAKIIFDV